MAALTIYEFKIAKDGIFRTNGSLIKLREAAYAAYAGPGFDPDNGNVSIYRVNSVGMADTFVTEYVASNLLDTGVNEYKFKTVQTGSGELTAHIETEMLYVDAKKVAKGVPAGIGYRIGVYESPVNCFKIYTTTGESFITDESGYNSIFG